MSQTATVRPRQGNQERIEKMGFVEATRLYIRNGGEINNFKKTAAGIAATMRKIGLTGAMIGPFDNALYLVPGPNLMAVTTDVLIIYGLWSVGCILRIRHKANKRLEA